MKDIWVRFLVIRTPSGKFIIYEEEQDSEDAFTGWYRFLKFADIDEFCQFMRDMNIVETELHKPDDDFTESEIIAEVYQDGIDPDPDNWKEQLEYEGMFDDDFSEQQVEKELQEESDVIEGLDNVDEQL